MLKANTKLLASPCLVSIPKSASGKSDGTVGVYDFLTKEFAYVETSVFYWLEYFVTEKTWSQTIKEHGTARKDYIRVELENLIQLGFITRSEDQLRRQHETFKRDWSLDLTSALFHFTIMNSEYASQEESCAEQLSKISNTEQPVLATINGSPDVHLPPPFSGYDGDLMEVICRRRTNRTSSGYCIRSSEIGSCLFSGLGITGFVKATAGMVPLSTTPSGGARNPFEAYVIVKRGHDLEPGAYHYSALEHTLQKIHSNQEHKLDAYLGKQDWATNMSACIFLVANLERTTWKYSDPNAYRVVLIEAGHIGQNIMLAATKLGLSACATGALSHADISRGLNLEKITEIPVYALTLDKPQPCQDESVPNERLAHFIPSPSTLRAHVPLE